MPVGVPEGEVFAAADAVLARGERPTVERVRAELGRGSPARVGKLLETWWDALAKRLAGETRLPHLPAQVAGAFTAVWGVACAQAREAAIVALNADRMQMEADRHLAAQSQAAAERNAIEAREAAANARQIQQQLQTRLTDLSDALEAQRQRADGLEANARTLAAAIAQRDQELRAADQALEHLRTEAASQRDKSDAHIRAVEDRAHAEVDRCRDEIKGLKRELTGAHRELLAATKARHASVRAQHDAEKRAVAAEARSRALEERLLASPLATPTSRRTPKSGRSSVPKPKAASRRVKS